MSAQTTRQELEALVLDLLPEQGEWSEEYYLWLTDQTNHLIEFADGLIEVLPMPTQKHQTILRYFFLAFLSFLQDKTDAVYFSPLRLRVREGKFREPDLLILLNPDDPRRQDRFWLGADLVLEVVSPDDRRRDLVTKRRDYAAAAIPEYWIANPLNETVMVLRLEGGRYVEHGVFAAGARATSALLPGFAVDVRAAFAARP
jgi:Uma2 family endonuclease